MKGANGILYMLNADKNCPHGGYSKGFRHVTFFSFSFLKILSPTPQETRAFVLFLCLCSINFQLKVF